MSGKEKLYFLLLRIEDARVITPFGQPLTLDPANDLNLKYGGLLRATMRKREKSIVQNRRKLTKRLRSYSWPMRNTI